jgi:hypothetical protein
MSARDQEEVDRWVDMRSAVAITGVRTERLAWAMANGEVRFSTSLAGHEHVPMVALVDAEGLAG